MQEYPTYGVKQTYVYVEEDNFMKGYPFYHDSDSSVQIMKPNQCTLTPPQNHHAQLHHGGFDKDVDDSWKMDKPSHVGGWSSDREQQHQHANWKTNNPSHGGSKYENSNDIHHSKMGGSGYHHGPPHMPPVVTVVWNEPVKRYSDDCYSRYYCTEHKSGQYWIPREYD